MAAAALLVVLTPNVLFLFLSLTLLGLAASIYHPVGLAMISLGVKAKGKAMGINGVAGSIGVAVGPALGLMLAYSGWWRLAYVIVALVSLLCLGYFHLVARKGPRPAPDHVPAPLKQIITPPPLPASEENGRGRWARYLPLILLYIAMMLGGFNYRVLITALPTYINGAQVSGAGLDLGAVKLFIALLMGGIGQYLGGVLADRHGARIVYPILIGSLVPLATVVGLLEGSALVFVAASFMAVALFSQQPMENIVVAQMTSRGRRGLSYASKFTLTFGFGALGNSAAGLILKEYHSFAPAFYVIAGSAFVMTILGATALHLSHRANGAQAS